MTTILSAPSRLFLVLSILGSCFIGTAAQAKYVQVKCTNRAGQVNFYKVLLMAAEYQLNNLKLSIDPRDERFPEIEKFLTTIPENKRQLNTRRQVRQHKGCQMGVCKYVYSRTYFPAAEDPIHLTTKAQFCANDPTAIKLRQVLTELENYAVED